MTGHFGQLDCFLQIKTQQAASGTSVAIHTPIDPITPTARQCHNYEDRYRGDIQIETANKFKGLVNQIRKLPLEGSTTFVD